MHHFDYIEYIGLWTPPERTGELFATEKPEEKTEKSARIYYQNIVYQVCNKLDKFFNNTINEGCGVYCGTANDPSQQTQLLLDRLVEIAQQQREEIKQLRSIGTHTPIV